MLNNHIISVNSVFSIGSKQYVEKRFKTCVIPYGKLFYQMDAARASCNNDLECEGFVRKKDSKEKIIYQTCNGKLTFAQNDIFFNKGK